MKRLDHIEVAQFSPDLRQHFADLNREWIEKYFEMEDRERYVLSEPEEAIILYGGQIYFAKVNSLVVGTCALVNVDEHTMEISKMAVTEKFQGLGIGTLLMGHVLAVAKTAQLKELILYSNRQLKSAIRMYENFGFVEVPKTDFHSKRSNIKMSLSLESRNRNG